MDIYIRCDQRENIHNDNTVQREDFKCMEVLIPTNGNLIRKARQDAERIYPNLNPGGANSSKDREPDIMGIDILSGMIAELACRAVLSWRYGSDKISRPESNTSHNQIDLKLYNGKTIEVRSSCVHNGIDFALFAKNRKNKNEQYFDIIGPYVNGYKSEEAYKDYYMRVLYHCDKEDFLRLLEHSDYTIVKENSSEMLAEPVLKLFVTGGATRRMMTDLDYVQEKHLIPADGEVAVESDYRVIPLAKSLDILEFFGVLEEQNKELEIKNKLKIEK